MTSSGRWASCLDDFDEQLAQQTEALEHGRPQQIVAFVPPAGLGPLPPALLPRARELSVRAEVLVEAVRAAHTRTAAALAQLAVGQEASRPSYVDSRL